MLKASRVLMAVLAALGMSSAIAQTGPVVGGYNTTTSGNTTSHTYAASGSSDMARLMRGGYDPATNQSGFQALLQKKGFTPKGSSYDMKVTKPVPKAAMAKAISKFALKVSPIGYAVGVFESVEDLLHELFPDKNVRWDGSQARWEYDETTETFCWDLSDRGWGCPATATAYCSAVLPGATFSIDAGGSSGRCRDSGGGQVGYPFNRIILDQSTLETPITEPLLEQAISALPTIPPEADPLVDQIPSAAKEQLARDIEADTTNKPRAVPMSPSGVESPSGLEIPESTITRQSTDFQERSQQVTEIIKTVVRTLPSGQLQHDTVKTTTTTTQTGTNPDGSPITETKTDTETTTTTPAPSPDGTNPTAPSENAITCGLPDTPPCKIDETGTPQADPAKTQEEIDSIFGQIKTCLQDIKTCLPALPQLSWSFALPSGCSPLTFDTLVGTVIEIDMCQHQPTIHDLMSMLWAAAGLFGAVSLVARFSAGGA